MARPKPLMILTKKPQVNTEINSEMRIFGATKKRKKQNNTIKSRWGEGSLRRGHLSSELNVEMQSCKVIEKVQEREEQVQRPGGGSLVYWRNRRSRLMKMRKRRKSK